MEVRLKFSKVSLGTLLLVLFSGLMVWANEEHGPAELDEKTIRTIIYQAINIVAIFVGLYYFLREPIRQYFSQKHKSYVAAAEKAMTAQKMAEEERLKIQVQLSKLETTTHESLARARAEAADLRNNLVAEAQALSKRIHEETHNAAILEIEKAKNVLRQEMINEAISVAQNQIRSAVSSEDHARLNKEFIQNIEAAQS